jgi:hypothetical protein
VSTTRDRPIRPHAVRLVVVGLLATSFTVLIDASPASACSCAMFTDTEAVASADAVFTGTLVDTIEPRRWLIASSGDAVRLVFDVDRVFKGEVHARQTVLTARDSDSCGLGGMDPGTHLVFAHARVDFIDGADDDDLQSGSCSGTRSLASGELPDALGAPYAPRPGSSSDAGGTSSTVIAVAATSVAGATLAAVWLRRRSRRRASG